MSEYVLYKGELDADVLQRTPFRAINLAAGTLTQDWGKVYSLAAGPWDIKDLVNQDLSHVHSQPHSPASFTPGPKREYEGKNLN